MKSFDEIGRMTLSEYEMRLKAYRLQTLEKQREIHEQAWANQLAKATRSVGKNKTEPYFKDFKSFFDYQKYRNEILGIEDVQKMDKGLSDLLIKANS